MSKVIIAGSRDIDNLTYVYSIINKSGIEITEVVCGCANGPDNIGKSWAEGKGIDVKEFPVEWDNLKAPNAVIRTNRYGKKYNAKAGFDRNQKMVDYADAAIFIWDECSNGTLDCINRANKKGIPIKLWSTVRGDWIEVKDIE